MIAAIHGTALGGGFEVALCAHYRVAVPSREMRPAGRSSSACMPGAGGTQRLPRIVGVEKALDMITSGHARSAPSRRWNGLVDELAEEGKLREGAIAFARKVVAEKRPLTKVRDRNDKIEAARGHPEIFANFRKANARKFRGFEARKTAIQCVEAAVEPAVRRGHEAQSGELFSELVPTHAVARPSATSSSPSAQVCEDPRRAGRHADACRSTRSASSAPARWAAASP